VNGGDFSQGEACTAIGRLLGLFEAVDSEAALVSKLEVDEGLIGPRTQSVATDSESVGGFSCT
jgi:hypothetical protein